MAEIKVDEKTAHDVERDVQEFEEGDSFVPPDKKEERKLLWKLDRRIIPYIGILYLCSFLDRVNIGKPATCG